MADTHRLNGQRHQQPDMGYDYMVDSGHIFRLPVYKRVDRRMELKLITIVVHCIGVMVFLGGILVNIGDWKSAVLFGLGALYGLARFVVYCVKSWQDIRWREKKLKGK